MSKWEWIPLAYVVLLIVGYIAVMVLMAVSLMERGVMTRCAASLGLQAGEG